MATCKKMALSNACYSASQLHRCSTCPLHTCSNHVLCRLVPIKCLSSAACQSSAYPVPHAPSAKCYNTVIETRLQLAAGITPAPASRSVTRFLHSCSCPIPILLPTIPWEYKNQVDSCTLQESYYPVKATLLKLTGIVPIFCIKYSHNFLLSFNFMIASQHCKVHIFTWGPRQPKPHSHCNSINHKFKLI